MPSQQRTYIAIDLKSFFASVECVERGLNTLNTHLVVADASRTSKTICLAISPSLKSYGLPGRARLFEVEQKVAAINKERLLHAPNHKFSGSSYIKSELEQHPELKLTYITATPRMSHYINYSTKIYKTYLKYVAPEDIHVYSIDEVFIDLTNYLDIFKMTARELGTKMILDVFQTTGITATAGIGSNLYLCKVAMDIMAKHVTPDVNGVRIVELNEQTYRKKLWSHTPLTDFWRCGKGIAKRLEPYGIHTMGDIARCSIEQEHLLYHLFGVNAELLIDHAWGWEPCTIKDIKSYKPDNNSISSGQVLHCPYNADKARVVVQEMTDAIALDLVSKNMVATQLNLTIGYDTESLSNLQNNNTKYNGTLEHDFYGRTIPKHAQGTIHPQSNTSSAEQLISIATTLFNKIVNKNLLIRRITISVLIQDALSNKKTNKEHQQLNLFSDNNNQHDTERLQKEHSVQETVVAIKKKFGKNAILKGLNYQDGATAKERNEQIGGHKA